MTRWQRAKQEWRIFRLFMGVGTLTENERKHALKMRGDKTDDN